MRSMTVFNYLLEATLFGSVFILISIAVRSIGRHRLGSRAVYASWILAAIRLLLPVSIPNPLMDKFRPGFSVDVAARPVAAQLRQRVIDASMKVSSFVGTGESGPLRDLARHTIVGETGKWVLIIWLIAAVGTGLWLWWRSTRFSDRVRRNRVSRLEGEDLALLHELCARYRVKPLPVYYVDRLPAACITGVIRPFIALPVHTPRAHLTLVLSHQLCHRRAHDVLWGVARNLCCAIHWFNPLVWMAAWLSWRDSEMACDDRVTARLPDMDRLAYADMIVSAKERSGDAMVSADAVGATFTDKHIRQRVSSVIRCVKGSRWAIALASLAAAVLLVFSFGTSESEPLPTVQAIPAVSWAAAATPLHTDMDAIACARRFLESDFVGENTDRLSFTARSDGSLWRIEAREGSASECVRLVFSSAGCLVEYNGLSLLGDISFTDTSYTHRALTGSVENYLTAFMTALVPECVCTGGRAEADVRQGDVRVLFGALSGEKGEPACGFALQVEPVVRMLYCAPR